jgi:hypothetical protein
MRRCGHSPGSRTRNHGGKSGTSDRAGHNGGDANHWGLNASHCYPILPRATAHAVHFSRPVAEPESIGEPERMLLESASRYGRASRAEMPQARRLVSLAKRLIELEQ